MRARSRRVGASQPGAGRGAALVRGAQIRYRSRRTDPRSQRSRGHPRHHDFRRVSGGAGNAASARAGSVTPPSGLLWDAASRSSQSRSLLLCASCGSRQGPARAVGSASEQRSEPIPEHYRTCLLGAARRRAATDTRRAAPCRPKRPFLERRPLRLSSAQRPLVGLRSCQAGLTRRPIAARPRCHRPARGASGTRWVDVLGKVADAVARGQHPSAVLSLPRGMATTDADGTRARVAGLHWSHTIEVAPATGSRSPATATACAAIATPSRPPTPAHDRVQGEDSRSHRESSRRLT